MPLTHSLVLRLGRFDRCSHVCELWWFASSQVDAGSTSTFSEQTDLTNPDEGGCPTTARVTLTLALVTRARGSPVVTCCVTPGLLDGVFTFSTCSLTRILRFIRVLLSGVLFLSRPAACGMLVDGVYLR